MLVQSAVVAPVLEGAQETLLQDSRVALNLTSIKGNMLAAADELTKLPSEVWTKLSTLCDIESCELRSASIESAHIAIAFMDVRVFSVAE